jgi:hypothetical protein
MPDKVMLFIQVVDVKDIRDLGPLLEDLDDVNGLTTDWDIVRQACSQMCKRLGGSMKDQLDDEIQPSEPAQLEERRPEIAASPSRRLTQDTAMEELVKGMRDLSHTMAQILLRQNSTEARLANFVRRYIWCDSTEHLHNRCVEHDEAVRRGIIFYRDRMVDNSITSQQLSTNFTKGGMKKLMEDTATQNVQATYYASSVGIRVEEGQ